MSADRGRCVVVLGNPENRRVHLFQAALARLGWPAAKVVSWEDFLTGRKRLEQWVGEDSLVRIESPGENFEVQKLLLMRGAEAEDSEESSARISRREIEVLVFDRGLILPQRQWFLGFCAALRELERQLANCPPHAVMNAPEEIAVMFDKRRCHERLAADGVRVPRALGSVRNWDELLHGMREKECGRVFVKPAHGSSASGTIALAVHGSKMVAYAAMEMIRVDGRLRLYNSLKVRRYEARAEIECLVNAVCRERAHVEQWLPKAGLDGQVFDLRVLVIGGRARHVVARFSSSPMTNLHLGNRRGELAAVGKRMGRLAWGAAMSTCERAATTFPGCHYAGIDLLIEVGFRRHAVLEVNAFGDLLPNCYWDDMSTYEAELACWDSRKEPVPC